MKHYFFFTFILFTLTHFSMLLISVIELPTPDDDEFSCWKTLDLWWTPNGGGGSSWSQVGVMLKNKPDHAVNSKQNNPVASVQCNLRESSFLMPFTPTYGWK